jgi:hypothetical protein
MRRAIELPYSLLSAQQALRRRDAVLVRVGHWGLRLDDALAASDIEAAVDRVRRALL